MPEQRASSVGWGFWFQWVLATTGGWVVGWVVGLIVQGGVHSAVVLLVQMGVGYLMEGGDVLEVAVAWTVIGLVGGTLQWLVLREKISQAGWWVLASTGGWAGGLFGGMFVAEVVLGFAGWSLGFAAGGAVLGLVSGTLQWLILQGKISQAGWWILASTGVWAMGWVIVGLVGGVGGLLVGLVATGSITGGVLVWLLRQPHSEAQGVAADDHHSTGGEEGEE